jgi:hypothetical protein
MKIRIKRDKKFINVEVREKSCRNKKCFIAGKYTHYSACGLSGCSHWTDENYSCLTRDNKGCPD